MDTKKYMVGGFMILALGGCTAEELEALRAGPTAPSEQEDPITPEPPCEFDDLALNGAERFQFEGAYRVIFDSTTSFHLMVSLFEDGHSAYAVHQGSGYIEDGRSSLTDTWVRASSGCKLEYRLANGTLRFTLQNPEVDSLGWFESVEVVDHAAGNVVRVSEDVVHMDVPACSGVF